MILENNPWIVCMVHFFIVITLSAVPEDKDILLTYTLCDLYIGSIHSADRQCTIHHKFHISCSRCFHSCGRNLLTDICCRNQYLRNRYTIIFYENYLNFSVHIWIFIYHFLNGMDQPYDLFCPGISRCCFRRKNKCDRCCNICWIFFDLLIYINDMQTF